MGHNFFFAYTVCIGMKIPWQVALGANFISSALFVLLSTVKFREAIFDSVPASLKHAIAAGIGLFIAFIGLQKAGLVASHPVTFVTAGRLSSPPALLALFGLVLTAVLVWRKVRGAIVLSILALTLLGFAIPAPDGHGALTHLPDRVVDLPASLAPTFLQLDLGHVFSHLPQTLPLILSLLFVDLFDNMGTLIGVSHRAGLLDSRGDLPKIGRALTADASAAMVGSCLGTSTVTSYIESAAGVEEGGRTGLTSLVVAGCFLLSLFFHPIIRMIPAVATAPALVIVGIFMMQGLSRLDLQDFAKAVPAVLIVVLMPLTFSISEGLAIGFLVYVVLMVGIGRAQEVSWVGYVLGGLFLLHCFYR
jgi:AGZA family xanthine/uracil permease-like MFS transporter